MAASELKFLCSLIQQCFQGPPSARHSLIVHLSDPHCSFSRPVGQVVVHTVCILLPCLLVWSREDADPPSLLRSLVHQPRVPLVVGSQQASRSKDPRLSPTPKCEGLCFSPWHLLDSFPHLRTFLFEMRPNTYTNIT